MVQRAGMLKWLVGTSLVIMAGAAAAQSADTLAMPVRKSARESNEAATDRKVVATAPGAETDQTATAERAVAKRLSSTLGGTSAKSSAKSSQGSDNKKESKSNDSDKTKSAAKSASVKSPSKEGNIRGSDDDNVYGILKRRKSASDETSVKKEATVSRKIETPAKEESRPPAKRTASTKSGSSSEGSTNSKKRVVEAEKSSDSSTKKAATSSKTARSSENESDKKVTSQDKSDNSPGATGEEIDADIAALDNLRPGTAMVGNAEMVPTAPEAGTGPEALPPMLNSAPLAAAAAPLPPVPNLYLSQPETKQQGGFLSKLFGRKPQAAASAVTASAVVPQINFTSDYAVRDDDAYCPAILPGAGLNGFDLPIGGEDHYRLTSSLPSTFRPTDLVKLPTETCHYGNALYLRREAAGQLCQMINAAGREGLRIRVLSAYRDYNHQLRLYNSAVARGGENQKMVARPGRSEHFLGTTVDLTNNEKHALARSFGDTPEGQWLARNAHRFGWKMTVMNKSGRRSHDEEPWHLRYLGANIDNPTGISPIVQQSAPAQRRDVFGKIGKFLGLRRD